MSHRWISGDTNDPEDVSLSCFVCGITVDFPASLEDEALAIVPLCEPNDGRSHHLILEPHPGLEGWYLSCAYGDAEGDEFDMGPGDYDPVCVGG